MNVKWNPALGAYYYDCAFGCYDDDFDSNDEAREAFLAHACLSEPCS